MKKYVLLIACKDCGYMQSFAQTNRGDSSLGFNLGYGFESENATLGIDYRYIDNISRVRFSCHIQMVVRYRF